MNQYKFKQNFLEHFIVLHEFEKIDNENNIWEEKTYGKRMFVKIRNLDFGKIDKCKIKPLFKEEITDGYLSLVINKFAIYGDTKEMFICISEDELFCYFDEI